MKQSFKKVVLFCFVAFFSINAAFAQTPQTKGKVLKAGDTYILDKAKLSAEDEKKVIALLKEKPELGHYAKQDGSATYGTKDMLSLTKAQKQILSDNNFSTSAIWLYKNKDKTFAGTGAASLTSYVERIDAIMKKYQ